MSRVLVTGGAGFIGGHLVGRLLGDGMDVTVLDDLSSRSMKNFEGHLGCGAFRFFRGDARDPDVLKRFAAEVNCVVHLAVTNVPFSLREPLLTHEVNVTSTLNLLKTCLDSGVKRFVFASSCAV